MLGEEIKCDRCDFGFCTGWSHHERGQLLACISCGTRFKACSAESAWGPDSKAPLDLLQERYVKKTKSWDWIDTGIDLVPSKTAAPGTKDGLFYFLDAALRDLPCPSCGSVSIVETIKEERPCPHCEMGKIRPVGTCIY